MTFTIAVLNKKKDSYLLYFFQYTVKHINSNLAFCFLSFLSLFLFFFFFSYNTCHDTDTCYPSALQPRTVLFQDLVSMPFVSFRYYRNYYGSYTSFQQRHVRNIAKYQR